MCSSKRDKREIGYGLIFLLLGLLLGIEGNFFVSFWMKAIETNYSPEWIVYSLVTLLFIVIFSCWLWRKAMNLVRSPKER